MDAPIQEIKERLDIIDTIGQYVQLKKAGTNYKGLCPFHTENSGSLMVSPAKQIWHCFGCGEGGDIIEFVKKIENISFPEALKQLADKAGVVLPEKGSGGPKKEVADQLYKINTYAAKLYHSLLLAPVGAEALAYIQHRGLSLETILSWQIGFAPESFGTVRDSLLAKKVTEQELLASGVCARSDRGGVYDRFRNRITFPIVDFLGKTVGFSARDFSGSSDAAKYINSPETVIYNKSKVLFGLYQAKAEARRLDYMVIVEGQMDCITAHQAGFVNTVATSGTALTQDHLRQLGRLTKNVMFCFDQDAAGREAARRAGLTALSQGFSLKVVQFSGAKDPDELIREKPEQWKQALKEAVWFVEFYIKKGLADYPFGSVEQKKYVSTVLLPLLGVIADPIEKEHYTHQITDLYGIGKAAFQETRNSHAVFPQTQATKNDQVNRVQIVDAYTQLEKELLGGILYYSDLAEQLLPILELDVFNNSEVKQALEFLKVGDRENIPEALVKEVLFMVEYGQEQHAGAGATYVRELVKTYYSLKLNALKINLQRLSSHIKQAEARGDRDQLQKLNTEYAITLAERTKLELRAQ